jgi:DNA-binding GntR family transcriptional regulator
MPRPQDPFSHAVAALRGQLRSGRLVQGEQLMANVIARQLELSPTPVREALARLAGEGLIEDRRGAGYFAWRLDAVDLLELHDLQAGYFAAALARDGGPPAAAASEAAPATDALIRIEALALALVRRGRSLALERAHLRLADLLAPARRIEGEVLEDAATEWRALAAALSAPALPPLQAWIAAYRARREAAAPALVSAMRSRAAEGRDL